MGDTMTREQVEAVAKDFDALAAQGRHTDGYLNAARILRRALAESEAPHVHEFHNAEDYTGNAFCECGAQQ